MKANEKDPKGQAPQGRKNDPNQDQKTNELPDEQGRQGKDVQKAPFQQGNRQQSHSGQGDDRQKQSEKEEERGQNVEKYKGANAERQDEESKRDDDTDQQQPKGGNR